MLNENTTEEMMEEMMKEELEETVETKELEEESLDELVENEVETEEPEEEESIFVGTVTNCKKLNIRETPSLQGKVLCVLEEGAELRVDKTESTDEWYKVYLESGFSGFCMKAYVGGE